MASITDLLVRIADPSVMDASAAAIVTAGEHAAAARFRFPDDRARFVAARALLRTMIGEALGVAPQSVCIEVDRYGKLHVAGIECNVSHSGDRIAIAIASEPVGIDVERIAAHVEVPLLAARYFNDSEQAWIEAQADRPAAFFRLWTMKESVMKADGRGMSLPLHDVTIDPDLEIGIVDGTVWFLAELDAGPGYAACVATRSRRLDVRVERGFPTRDTRPC